MESTVRPSHPHLNNFLFPREFHLSVCCSQASHPLRASIWGGETFPQKQSLPQFSFEDSFQAIPWLCENRVIHFVLGVTHTLDFREQERNNKAIHKSWSPDVRRGLSRSALRDSPDTLAPDRRLCLKGKWERQYRKLDIK